MSHNRKYYSKFLKRNTVKSKNITGIFESIGKRYADKTENAVSDRELKVDVAVSVPCSSTSSVNEREKILVNDDENTPVISQDSISNQSEVVVKPVHVSV